jgi:Cu+-exporting ATPase
MKKDPVCGMDVSETDAAGSVEYEGVTYYFCSEACRRRFVASPAEFAR